MTLSEEIQEWIDKYGNERDALNVALAKLKEAHEDIETEKRIAMDSEMCTEVWVAFMSHDRTLLGIYTSQAKANNEISIMKCRDYYPKVWVEKWTLNKFDPKFIHMRGF